MTQLCEHQLQHIMMRPCIASVSTATNSSLLQWAFVQDRVCASCPCSITMAGSTGTKRKARERQRVAAEEVAQAEQDAQGQTLMAETPNDALFFVDTAGVR